MPTNTTNYSFKKPVVGADEDLWGGYINDNFDSLDSLLSGTTALTSLDLSGSLTVGDGLTVGNDGATVLTVDRATSDGTLVDFKKDNVSRGQIKMHGDRLVVGSGDASLKFDNGANDILPWNIGTDAAQDNTVDLGSATARFNELFLGGGVYLGGTGSANYLDDYEEGTWTPSIQSDTDVIGTTIATSAIYVKTGGVVRVSAGITRSDTTAWSGAIRVAGLPYAVAGTELTGSFWVNNASSNFVGSCYVYTPYNGAVLRNDGNSSYILASNWGNGRGLYFTFTYRTNA